MILIFVSAKPRQGMTGDFEQALEPIATAARQLPGRLGYEWYQASNPERRDITFGEFDTRTNFEDYLKSDVVKQIGQEFIPLPESKPEFKHDEAKVFKQN